MMTGAGFGYLRDGTKMLEEMALSSIRRGGDRYQRAIAAMRDTSGFVTARVPHAAKPKLQAFNS